MKIYKKILNLLLVFILTINIGTPIYAADDDAVEAKERTSWFFNTTNTSTSSTPSNLKFFEYYDILPDELNLKIFDNMDLTHIEGKKLYVGYGIADPNGKDCKIFPKFETGADHDIKVCLPYWRAEREYISDNKAIKGGLSSLIKDLRKQKPPLMISMCTKRDSAKVYPGGKVTCTAYFDALAGEDCYTNPKQSKCYVNNCGGYLKEQCKFDGLAMGEKETLETATYSKTDNSKIDETSTKLNLVTMQYTCPSGTINVGECLEENKVMMFPAKCKEDVVETEADESEYIYCNKKDAFYENGTIAGFNGKCSDGKEVVCEINKFTNSKAVCLEPIYEDKIEDKVYEINSTRSYDEKVVDVLSGEPDEYSGNANCLRSNTVEDARDQELYVKINGNGSLDDDIYVLRHKADGTHSKVYCNMQHAERRGNRKSYNGDVLQCIDNNGNYSFNKTITIDSTDIVSVQQNSENENQSGTPFALGRNHYNSTSLHIDGILVAPETKSGNYPYYPSNGIHLKTWDNVNSTLSLLFPFAGAYELFFYNKNGKEIVRTVIDLEDFKSIADSGYMPLSLGQIMKLAPGRLDDELDDEGQVVKYNANRNDSWVEWGGGVYGGRNSKDGKPSQSPLDNYVKENSITNIIIKDLLTSSITQIPLTYPIAYPNRIFISKLNVYEHRKYRCYKPFETPYIIKDSKINYACSTDQEWKDFKNGLEDIKNVNLWVDNQTCEQNCREYKGCVAKNDNFTCDSVGTKDIGGDIEGNLFSDKDECDAKCYTQNSCEDNIESSCETIDEQVSDPATDITGKTIFRKRSMSFKCTSETKEQVGCSKYDIKTIEGDIEYNFGATGWETKDFSGDFEAAVAMANMLEVGSLHIWSGWQGKCVKGMKWDFSYLSDPMTIASYAYSAYKAYTWDGWSSASEGADGADNAEGGEKTDGTGDSGANGATDGATSYFQQLQEGWGEFVDNTGINEAIDKVQSTVKDANKFISDTYDSLTSSISKTYESMLKSAKESLGITETITDTTTDAAKEALEKAAENTVKETVNQGGMLEQLKKSIYDTIEETTKGSVDPNAIEKWFEEAVVGEGKWYEITKGELTGGVFSIALDLSAPKVEDYELADRMLHSYYGYQDKATDVQAYNSCMASIGASMPNLIAWSAGEKNGIPQLNAPWSHPLRMTAEQLNAIRVTTSDEYMMSSYMYNNEDSVLFNVKAKTSDAYLRAAKTVCMGADVSKAAAQIEKDQAEKSSGMSGGDVAMAVAKAAIGMVCPPCSFALTVVMDLYSNVFAKIDTCKNEEDAMMWDILHYKTQKFLNFDQCVLTESYCDKEAWFGFKKKCVRKGYDYCCYDQITTKVFAEGLKDQMYRAGDKNKWNSCNDITVNDLKNLSFRECKPGETPYVDKCMDSSRYSEFTQVLMRQTTKGFSMENLSEQVINSMAIETE